MRRRLLTLLLLLPVLLIAVALAAFGWLWYSESGARWLWQEVGERLAASPRGARLEGRISGSLGGGLRFSELDYRDDAATVAAEKAEISVRLGLRPATVFIQRLALEGVEVDIAETGAPRPDASEPPGAVSTPVPLVIEALRIDGAVVRRGDTQVPIHGVTAQASWADESLALEVSSLDAPLLAGSLELDAKTRPPFPLQSSFRVHRFTLPEPARSELGWLPESLESQWALEGDLDRIELEGEVRWPEWMPRASVSGRLQDPLGDLRWSLEVDAPEALLPEEWQGRLADAVAPGSAARLAVQALELTASGGKTAFEFRGTADLRSPWTRTASVAVEGAGEDTGNGIVIAHWAAQGEAEIAAPDWPAATVGFAAGGRQDRISASVDAPDLFGGSLSVSAETRPGDGTPWEAELTARQVATAPILETLAPQLGADRASQVEAVNEAVSAESVDAHIRARGLLDPLQFSADVLRLDGKVRGRAVSAGGQLEYGENQFSATDFVLESGDSRLVLNGSLAGPPGLRAQVNVATLGDFLPGASGAVSGEVSYRHDPARGFSGSRLRADLQGSELQAFDWSIEDLRISGLEGAGERRHPAVAAVPDDAPLAVSLRAQGIDGPLGTLSEVSATLAGTFERHAFTATAVLPDAQIEAVVSGGATGETLDAWSGTLEALEVDPAAGEAWQLQEPADVRFAQQLTLEPACFSPGGGPELCLDFEQEPGGVQRGTAELSSLPIDMLARLVDSPLKFTQRLGGEVSWSRAPGAKVSATGAFTVTEGAIIESAENARLLNTQDGLLRFSMDQGSLHSGAFKLPFDSGNIAIDFRVPDLLAGAESELDGQIRVVLDDLDALANFVPQLAQTEGRLQSDIRVTGTAGDPRLDGVIELHDGRTHVLAPGLTLHDIELKGTLDARNRIEFDGSFVAGEGLGQVDAVLDLGDTADPVLHVKLSGNSLTLIDIPDLRVLADTEVTADWRGDVLRLSGQVHVPSARFAPRYLPSETVSQSPDVVIVAGGPANDASPKSESDLQIQGELIVSLGHDVVIDLDLARATMTGAALFRWSGPLVPIASGGYDIRGEIQAYGQTLEITQASVRFPNVPADNPHLHVRAERRIYGNSLITKAGVLVSGTLRRPQTEPYTVPSTNADRARTLLLTGSDFDYEKGVGALNVGTYVAPKLYLSYGVGLFEEGNVLTARYDLGENLGIKATSGQNDAGIDISYTIEK